MDAMELAQSMMRMPVKDLPVMAKVYLEDLSSRIGVCGECCLMAFCIVQINFIDLDWMRKSDIKS